MATFFFASDIAFCFPEIRENITLNKLKFYAYHINMWHVSVESVLERQKLWIHEQYQITLNIKEMFIWYLPHFWPLAQF